MTHGDDQGLILPPRLAPIQAVIVPIFKSDAENGRVMEAVSRVEAELKAAGIRVKVDDRTEVTPGFKFNDWEMRGVPLRIEIGPKDVEKGTRRPGPPGQARAEGKSFVPQAGLAAAVTDLLADIQKSLLERATAFRDIRQILRPQAGWLQQSQTCWWISRNPCWNAPLPSATVTSSTRRITPN